MEPSQVMCNTGGSLVSGIIIIIISVIIIIIISVSVIIITWCPAQVGPRTQPGN